MKIDKALEGIPDNINDAIAESTKPKDWETDGTEGDAGESGTTAYLREMLHEHGNDAKTKTLQDRDRWYQVTKKSPAPILIPSAQRDNLRIVQNKTDARHLNNCYRITPNDSLDTTDAKALLAYLNSDTATQILRGYTQTRVDGREKFEPGRLEEVPVIDPRELPDIVVTDLAQAYERLCKAARDDEGNDPGRFRTRIDRILQQDAGLSES